MQGFSSTQLLGLHTLVNRLNTLNARPVYKLTKRGYRRSINNYTAIILREICVLLEHFAHYMSLFNFLKTVRLISCVQ